MAYGLPGSTAKGAIRAAHPYHPYSKYRCKSRLLPQGSGSVFSWSPAGKGLTSWLSFVVSSVSLSLSRWYPGSGVVLDCIDS